MNRLTWAHIRRGLLHPSVWMRGFTVLCICLALGLPVGAVIGLLGGLYGSALIIALIVAYLMLRSALVGLVVLISVICLLPFAALPVDIGFSPTLLDLVLLMLFFVWASRLVVHKEEDFVASNPTLGVLVFATLAVVSFVVGLSHTPLTANVVRHFVEILLSIFVFLLVINTVRTEQQLEILVMALILGGFAAACIGVILYILPKDLAIRLLSLLRVVRYPSGAGVLRYIEDDPELPLRAVSTSIDPNVLGGLLIFVTSLTTAQALTKNPIISRKWSIPMLITMGLCMILTFSRGSFLGLAVALFLMGLLRYRRILWIGLVVIAFMFLLPPAQVYIQHFIEGIRGQDLATQMRFGEYKDALILISRYPWLGVGFSGTPDIDTYLGVSSVYLLIAEEMGILGLLAFVGTLCSFLISAFSTIAHCPKDSALEPVLLGTCLAVAGAMVGGTLDHYLFNISFPHASALLWLMIGLGTVSIRLVKQSLAETERKGQQYRA